MSKLISTELSKGLSELLNQFSPHAEQGVDLSPTEVSNVVLILAALHRLSVSVEKELNCHRLGEANRIAGEMVENVSAETFVNLLVETDGNIIRPNFCKEPQTS